MVTRWPLIFTEILRCDHFECPGIMKCAAQNSFLHSHQNFSVLFQKCFSSQIQAPWTSLQVHPWWHSILWSWILGVVLTAPVVEVHTSLSFLFLSCCGYLTTDSSSQPWVLSCSCDQQSVISIYWYVPRCFCIRWLGEWSRPHLREPWRNFISTFSTILCLSKYFACARDGQPASTWARLSVALPRILHVMLFLSIHSSSLKSRVDFSWSELFIQLHNTCNAVGRSTRPLTQPCKTAFMTQLIILPPWSQ